MNIIAKKYVLTKRLGQGQFGAVCQASCLKTKKLYAVKLESKDVEFSLLKHEATILYHLSSQKCTHIPYIYFYGICNPYVCIVMTYYEGSLDIHKDQMDLEEKVIWWNQMLTAISKIHQTGIVHRDIKPQHFMKLAGKSEWHLIDFGLATSYMIESRHVIETPKDSIIGTPNYVSYYVHLGKEHVRRDDFLSLLYIFIELFYENILLSGTDTFETYLRQNESTTCLEPTHIQYPYNQWLLKQKEWSRLYEILAPFEPTPIREAIYFYLTHAERLYFHAKPNYHVCMIDLVANDEYSENADEDQSTICSKYSIQTRFTSMDLDPQEL